MATWRLARALEMLRKQVNERYPNRSKISDGALGDTAHAARKSDHNPNAAGVVQAIDITHDLDKKGDDFDAWAFAETLRLNRDPRIKYVISNSRICGSPEAVARKQVAGPPWEWHRYSGSNAHAHHTHISVLDDPSKYDDSRPWRIDPPAGEVIVSAPVVPPPAGITDALRQRMAAAIVGYEAARDKAGHLLVHRPSDGSVEVAGINDQYHPKEVATITAMLAAGRHAEAEKVVQAFILANTKVATGWTTDAGVEFYLRDCVFNRGPKGGARILQRAVGVPDDGEVGQITRGAIGRIAPATLLTKLRAARESYERDVVGYRAALWAGLVSRWDKSLAAARTFQQEAVAPRINMPMTVPDKPAAPPTNNTQKIGIGAAILAGLWAVVTFIQDHPVAVFSGIAVAIAIGAVWSFISKRAPRSPVD